MVVIVDRAATALEGIVVQQALLLGLQLLVAFLQLPRSRALFEYGL